MPETSATVILQVASLTTGRALHPAGPGLREPARCSRSTACRRDFAAIWQRNHALFPRGIDLILCAGNQLDRPAPQRHRAGGLNHGLCRSQRRRAGDRQRPCLAGRGTPRRPRHPGPVRSPRSSNNSAASVDRVMAEGSLYDRELAALAIKQAQGDLIEAAFLLRAYRTTLPRFAHSKPVETAAMRIERRVSAIFKDLPGGQVLGPTYDYTHRLLDFSLLEDGTIASGARPAGRRRPGDRCRAFPTSSATKACWNPTPPRTANPAT